MIKKVFVFFVYTFSLCIIAFGLLFMLQPLRMSESVIKNKMLNDTPLGSSYTDVKRLVKKNGWYDKGHLNQRGFLKQLSGEPPKEIGAKSIRGELGMYPSIFNVHVTAFWGFNEDDELIDIWIWKTTDAL